MAKKKPFLTLLVKDGNYTIWREKEGDLTIYRITEQGKQKTVSTITFTKPNAKKESYINLVETDEKFKRLGLQTALVKIVEQEARLTGIKKLMGHIPSQEARGLLQYSSLGFKEISGHELGKKVLAGPTELPKIRTFEERHEREKKGEIFFILDEIEKMPETKERRQKAREIIEKTLKSEKFKEAREAQLAELVPYKRKPFKKSRGKTKKTVSKKRRK